MRDAGCCTRHSIKIKRDFVAKSIVVCLKGSQRQFKVCKLSLPRKKVSSDSTVIVKLSRFRWYRLPTTTPTTPTTLTTTTMTTTKETRWSHSISFYLRNYKFFYRKIIISLQLTDFIFLEIHLLVVYVFNFLLFLWDRRELFHLRKTEYKATQDHFPMVEAEVIHVREKGLSHVLTHRTLILWSGALPFYTTEMLEFCICSTVKQDA